MQNSLPIKAHVRAVELPRRTSENNPWYVFYDSISSHRPLVALRSGKKQKLQFFNNKTQSFSWQNGQRDENDSRTSLRQAFLLLTIVIDSSASIYETFLQNLL